MVAEISILEPLLTVEEIARRLNITPHLVNRLIRDGHLTGYKVGREWRVDPQDFEDYLRRQRRPRKIDQ